MTIYYSIDDAVGDRVYSGIQSEHKARELAQKYANDLGQPVLLYSNDPADEGEVIEPESAGKPNERLNRAAKHIGATDLGDGTWAHYADETSRWYVVSEDDMESLCDYLDDPDEQISSDAYSHWCAGTEAKEQSEGWEP